MSEPRPDRSRTAVTLLLGAMVLVACTPTCDSTTTLDAPPGASPGEALSETSRPVEPPIVEAPPADTAAVSMRTTPLGLGELPSGHWESGDAFGKDHLCLTIYPYGGVRIVVPAAGYRNPARVTGTVVGLERVKAGVQEYIVTIEVARIVAKEIGACRRSWVDYTLDEATILGMRVTPPPGANLELPDAKTDRAALPPAPRVRFSLALAGDGTSAELCALDGPRDATAPRCATLTKQPSTHTTVPPSFRLACEKDSDCRTEHVGELCTPCGCPNAVYSTTERQDDDEVLDARHEMRRECPPVPRQDCAPCPRQKAYCRHRRCELVKDLAP